MRKVTKQVMSAFINGNPLTVGNTETDGESVWLFGNKIAQREDGQVQVNFCGWNSKTTKERINGLCDLLEVEQVPFQTGWIVIKE